MSVRGPRGTMQGCRRGQSEALFLPHEARRLKEWDNGKRVLGAWFRWCVGGACWGVRRAGVSRRYLTGTAWQCLKGDL